MRAHVEDGAHDEHLAHHNVHRQLCQHPAHRGQLLVSAEGTLDTTYRIAGQFHGMGFQISWSS